MTVIIMLTEITVVDMVHRVVGGSGHQAEGLGHRHLEVDSDRLVVGTDRQVVGTDRQVVVMDHQVVGLAATLAHRHQCLGHLKALRL